MSRILHLTLERKWFDMIASGEKREEYREMKRYWDVRLLGKSFDVVWFRNGYGASAPTMTVELRSIATGVGRPEWGAPIDKSVYILWLGAVLSITNQEANRG